ncbi:MAG: hypothetical protein PSX81_13260 [bacterium]|nr:hypothetical protein [bacterium]
MDLVNKSNSQLNENRTNTSNQVFVREFSIKTDEQGFSMFKSELTTYVTIIDSNQFNEEVTKDTLRINEELKLCEINKINYLKTLDTMSPVSKNYERINRELNSLYSKIAQKNKDKESIRKQMKYSNTIKIKVYRNNSKYNQPYGYYKKKNWENYFMPGLTYNQMTPVMKDSFGVFSGFTPKFVFYSKYNRNAKGPSYLNVYGRVGILKSNKKSIGKILVYSIGANFSFENKITRNYLVPYFGLEIGGINQNALGASLFGMPQLGVYLYTTKKIQAYINGGYVYALNHTYEYESYNLSAGINFLLWR